MKNLENKEIVLNNINNRFKKLEKSVATITKEVNTTIKLNKKIARLGASACCATKHQKD